VTVPVDRAPPAPTDPDPRGWRRITDSRSAVAFAVAAIVTLLVRLIALPLTYGPRPEVLTVGAVGGLAAVAAVALPAFLLVPPGRPTRAVDLLVVGFALIAVTQMLAALLAAAFVVALRSATPTTATSTLIYLANPAVAITAAVGAVLIPFGLARRIRATAGASNVAVGCLGVALWLLLAAAVLLEYLTAYSLSPLRAFGTIAIKLVALSGWIGTALYAARYRSRALGSLEPLALGAGLIAISGVVGTLTIQLVSSDRSGSVGSWIAAISGLDGLLVAVGWGLLLRAAIRGLPGPWWAAPDPPRPDAAATMNDP
jgi:hypothetical protein